VIDTAIGELGTLAAEWMKRRKSRRVMLDDADEVFQRVKGARLLYLTMDAVQHLNIRGHAHHQRIALWNEDMVPWLMSHFRYASVKELPKLLELLAASMPVSQYAHIVAACRSRAREGSECIVCVPCENFWRYDGSEVIRSTLQRIMLERGTSSTPPAFAELMRLMARLSSCANKGWAHHMYVILTRIDGATMFLLQGFSRRLEKDVKDSVLATWVNEICDKMLGADAMANI
jgi:hypothetical protein